MDNLLLFARTLVLVNSRRPAALTPYQESRVQIRIHVRDDIGYCYLSGHKPNQWYFQGAGVSFCSKVTAREIQELVSESAHLVQIVSSGKPVALFLNWCEFVAALETKRLQEEQDEVQIMAAE